MHLFVVSTNEIDPRIDTWPVNFEDLEFSLAVKKSLLKNI